jgi:hypothetical protein
MLVSLDASTLCFLVPACPKLTEPQNVLRFTNHVHYIGACKQRFMEATLVVVGSSDGLDAFDISTLHSSMLRTLPDRFW